MKRIQLSSEMSASELKAFKAELAASKKNKVRYRMNERHYNQLIEEESEVLTPEGKLLGVLVKGRVPVARLAAAYPYLRMVNGSFTNRGSAIGLPMALRQRLDGSIANTQEVNPKELERQNVGLNDYFGFWEGKAQRNNPFPHETSFTRWLKETHPEGEAPLIRLAQAADQLFKKYAEPYWYAQLELAARIPKYVLPGTSFTTCTINKTYTAPDGVVKDVQTSPHLDKGDFQGALGVMLCQFRGANVDGFHLCIPRYRVAFRFRSTDLLLCNVHELHGNTNFVASGPFERISCVYYLRPKIVTQVVGQVSRVFLSGASPHALVPAATSAGKDNEADQPDHDGAVPHQSFRL
jgi:hypothetical protein